MSIEKLQAMVDSGRLRRSAVDLIEEMGGDRIRELAERLEEMATAIDTANDRIEVWSDEDVRGEEKAEARDEALEAIEELCRIALYDVGEVVLPDWLREVVLIGTEDEINAKMDEEEKA